MTARGWLLTLLGDAEHGRQLTGWGEIVGPNRMEMAVASWKSGEPEPALRMLGSVSGYTSTFYRGLILAELGRDREAVDTFRRFRRAPDLMTESGGSWVLGMFPGLVPANYALSLYHEAVSLDRLGERDEARRLLDRLLRLWNRADASQPMLREAKALRKRLAAAR